MELTGIGFQKTPARPAEVTFAAAGGLPNPNQTVNLIGHMGPTGGPAVSGASSGTAIPYEVVEISNAGDVEAGKAEAEAKFGAGSELAKMVIAAIKANALVGSSNFPALKATPLQQTDEDFGADDAALTAAARLPAEFLVSPYDGQDDTDLNDKVKDTAALMSGATRTQNGQYGTTGVCFNRGETDPSALHKYDKQFMMAVSLRDTGEGDDAPAYSVAEMAAACAASAAANPVPFNPLDDSVIGGVDAPAKNTDWYTIGAQLESEAALNRGWTPLRVLTNGDVAFVRTVTTRITIGDGETEVLSYIDLQDFQVLYFFRKAVVTSLKKPPFNRTKASQRVAQQILGEVLRLAQAFEDQAMFQNVKGLAKEFKVERNASDRSRFDVFVPVNVVPGLHVMATNIQATTEGDVFTV